MYYQSHSSNPALGSSRRRMEKPVWGNSGLWLTVTKQGLDGVGGMQWAEEEAGSHTTSSRSSCALWRDHRAGLATGEGSRWMLESQETTSQSKKAPGEPAFRLGPTGG